MYLTIPQLLAGAAERDPGGIWLRSDDLPAGLTFEGAVTQVARTAGRLAQAGVRKGDLVVVTARSTPRYLLVWLALVSLGAISVPTNPESAPAELAGLLGQGRPRALVSDAGLAEVVAEAGAAALAELGVLDVGELTPAWDRPAASEALPDAGVTPDDLAVLLPTSGTTGRSKLVMQPHRTYSMAGEGFPYWMELTAADRMMTSLPLFHINALAYSVMGSLACGAGLVLLPRFSARDFLAAARRHGATEFNAIGAMLEILMRQPESSHDADTALRLCYTGPAPTQQRQEEIEARFGLRIVVGYAMSETTYGLIWPRGTRPYGTLGTVRQHPREGVVNQARIARADGSEVGVDEVGQLLLRNPAVTPGYWNMPDETARAIVDGWLHTGDLVTRGEDGMVTFVGREKEVIRRRGENLSPLEVEEVLTAHPAVVECAVVGVPSDLSEEEVKAFVVAVAGTAPDFVELHAWVAERLAAFKVPRYWQALTELPHTPTGRVAKHRLPIGHHEGEHDSAGVVAPAPAAAGEDHP